MRRDRILFGLLLLSVLGNVVLLGRGPRGEVPATGAPGSAASGEEAPAAAGRIGPPVLPARAGASDEVAPPTDLDAMRQQVADLQSRLEEEDLRNALLRERLDRTTAELAPGSTRAVLKDLLDLRRRLEEARDGDADAEADALEAELMPKVLRFLADRDSALEALFEVIGDPDDPGRAGALELLRWATRIPGMSPEQTADMNQSLVDVLARETDAGLARRLIDALDLEGDAAGQRRAEPVLHDLLRHEDVEVREESIEKLDDIETESARAAIYRVASDPTQDTEVREQAVRSLDPERGAAETEMLLALSHDEDPEVREAAYDELSNASPELALPRLHEAALSDPDPDAQRDAIDALDDIGDASTVELLRRIENDPAYDVETRAEAKDAREDLERRLAREAKRAAEGG